MGNSAYRMIPGDKILPMVSILEKLKQIDPDAPQKILDLTDVMADERRRVEMELLDLKYPAGLRGVMHGLASIFREPAQHPTRLLLSETQAANYAWAQTGNDVRAALRSYIKDNAEVAEKAQLTPDEMADLKPLDIWMPESRRERLSWLSAKDRPAYAEKLGIALHV